MWQMFFFLGEKALYSRIYLKANRAIHKHTFIVTEDIEIITMVVKFISYKCEK